jgi:hypothetical protein
MVSIGMCIGYSSPPNSKSEGLLAAACMGQSVLLLKLLLYNRYEPHAHTRKKKRLEASETLESAATTAIRRSPTFFLLCRATWIADHIPDRFSHCLDSWLDLKLEVLSSRTEKMARSCLRPWKPKRSIVDAKSLTRVTLDLQFGRPRRFG